jgi:LysR family transcriptional regulator for bpeEF and oprC
MDRLDAMRLFVRVVETGSFSRAAREHGIGQPAVSKQIAALEAQIGAQLLQRTSRSVRATQTGADFYATAARLVDELDLALARARDRDRAVSGLVRVTVAPAFGQLYVVPRLPELTRRHPSLAVELVVSERALDLVEHGIDVAVRSGALEDSSLLVQPLGSSPLVTVGSSEYLDRRGTPRSPSELASHDCITYVARGAPRAWRYAVAAVHRPRGAFRSNDADQIRRAAVGGLGLAQVPGWLVARELAAGALRAVLLEHEPPPIPIAVVRPPSRRLAAKVRVIIELLREIVAAEPMLSGA